LCHFSIWLVLRVFNIDNFGIARAEVAEFAAHSSGIVFAVEQFSLLVISRPLAVAAGVPTGDDPCIRPGAKCDAVGHGALSSLPPFETSESRSLQISERLPRPERRHSTHRGRKMTHVRKTPVSQLEVVVLWRRLPRVSLISWSRRATVTRNASLSTIITRIGSV
jgi:hypothetical protein